MNSLKVTWILGFNGAEKAYFRGSFLTCPYTTFLSSGTATYREVFFPASHKLRSFLLPVFFFCYCVQNPIVTCSDPWGNDSPDFGFLHKRRCLVQQMTDLGKGRSPLA